MNFKPFDRLPMIEWAMWWDKTIARWHSEGLPASCSDRYDLYDYFGLDMYRQDWIQAWTPDCPKPAFHGAGIIENESDYERLLPMLYPPLEPWRIRCWEDWAAEQSRGDAVLWFTVEGFFWLPRTLLGIERHLYAFYDQPDLIHRINGDLAEWMLKIMDALCAICVPDFMTFAEDMSYNNGPMLSREMFDEFLKPYYDLVVPILHKQGILAIVDSDGDVTAPAHWFEAAGLDGILPLERQAGVDIARLRREHPTMRFIGHFDKMTMDKGEAAMRAEFERLLPIAAGGGFLPSVDHQTPPGVSLENYRVYLRLYREYAEEAGRRSRAEGIVGAASQV